MAERLTAIVPVVMPVLPVFAVESARTLRQGELLQLTVSAQHTNGLIELQREGLTLRLSRWPAALAQQVVGAVLQLKVVSTLPKLTLAWVDAAPAHNESKGSVVHAWQPEQAAMPRWALQPLDAKSLGLAWRAAVLGRMAEGSVRSTQELAPLRLGAWLLAAPELPSAVLHGNVMSREASLPLWLPLWLWGGPTLAMSVEDALHEQHDSEQNNALDLVLDVDLPGLGALRLSLRQRSDGVMLFFAASVEVCDGLRARQHLIQQAVVRAGGVIIACHIAEQAPLPPLPAVIPAGSYSLAVSLFTIAAEILIALSGDSL